MELILDFSVIELRRSLDDL